MGPRENILSYSMEDGVGAAEYRENLSKILEPLTADDEVVVLGDIIGGSPLTNALDLLAKKACFLIPWLLVVPIFPWQLVLDGNR